MVLLKRFTKTMMLGALALLLLPIPSPVPALLQHLEAQAFPGRLRRPPAQPGEYPPPSGAQTSAPVPSPTPSPAPAPAAPQSTAPPTQLAAPLPPSLLQQPAQPATIQFSAQTLSIHAHNSSLQEILHQLSQQTGMDVQGFGSDERVFGSFGPGKPQDVVADLLNGTPYNVLMVGVLANGAPRQLVLSPVSHAEPSAAPAPPPANDDSDTADDDAQHPPQAMQNQPRAGEPPSPDSPLVRTPQQLFQQLQQMREREMQQQPQQQPSQQPPQPQQQQQQ